MSFNLEIKEEKYKIKVGREVYSLDYPSFKESKDIGASFVGKSNEEAVDIMKAWLIKLGLDEKFFELKGVKGKHVIQLWEEVNTVKK